MSDNQEHLVDVGAVVETPGAAPSDPAIVAPDIAGELPGPDPPPDDHGAAILAAKPPKRRIDWRMIEAEYCRGFTDATGALVLPTLEEIAARHQVDRRTVERHSSRGGWTTKREQHMVEAALEITTRRIAERLRESDRGDSTTGALARALYNEIARAVVFSQSTASPDPRILKSLSEALLNSQKVHKLSLGLPTELLAHAEDAERKRQERLSEAGRTLDATSEFFARFASLEGPDFLCALEKILGPTPAAARGKVIDIKALRKNPDPPDESAAG